MTYYHSVFCDETQFLNRVLIESALIGKIRLLLQLTAQHESSGTKNCWIMLLLIIERVIFIPRLSNSVHDKAKRYDQVHHEPNFIKECK